MRLLLKSCTFIVPKLGLKFSSKAFSHHSYDMLLHAVAVATGRIYSAQAGLKFSSQAFSQHSWGMLLHVVAVATGHIYSAQDGLQFPS
jgi:hypothetical protein